MHRMDVLSITRAAEQLRCGRATLYRAIERGEINALDTGSAKVIVADEKWRNYEPERTGARAKMLNELEDNADDANS
jgi:excisionase family DNA binding protein